MRLIIDTDIQYKTLFIEVAKVINAKVQIDENYLTEKEEELALAKLVESGSNEGRMSDEEQREFTSWLGSR
ncbi:hypothetical protein [Larkinella terrae]|uniref:Uncharacterized protein n=1 Tax=Larkinella terrae TaxID=2025311 RepID=A0A7K0EJG8_9BACT|nr:hypothetical protein [Larkinella terrae]MRS61606.1 hypothetical protein [Larkinella terrae]